ncbi:hypothetical protein [Halomonas sp. MES3-P3E]|uniref:hypothetical protein n=1 Tax=Halomonas sp. MES3-P3E TaxID=2058321 RepID=UPI000C3458CD|nr:hypothetical protein [Halomonas sp. MES3-P3E]PKG54861.1 hypothetical protein CXF87_00805 [Halomonas sp. MES3-P3E]
MKLQLTALGAAIALSSNMAMAQTVTSPNNLDYIGAESSPPSYGVDNKNSNFDNATWVGGLPARITFQATTNGQSFGSELSSMGGSTAFGENKSLIEQETQSGGPSIGNSASVVQINGTDNDSSVDQNKQQQGDALEAEVVQSGNENRSDISQDLSYGAIAKVYQTGNGNLSRIDQLGADSNGAEVTQTGDNHRSIVEQGTNPGGAQNNNAFVTQTLMDSQSFVRQQWDGNLAVVAQDGTSGMSQIWQQSDNNVAKLWDTGAYNGSYIRQGVSGTSDYNDANVEQSGEYNDSYISQSVGDFNEADVIQSGDYGKSDIVQTGRQNEADVDQSGGGDISWVIQNGNNQYAKVEQTGSGTAEVEFNESYIMQTGGGTHSADVYQNHYPTSGYNNVSTITQLGSTMGNATVVQNGAGNRASTIQN